MKKSGQVSEGTLSVVSCPLLWKQSAERKKPEVIIQQAKSIGHSGKGETSEKRKIKKIRKHKKEHSSLNTKLATGHLDYRG